MTKGGQLVLKTVRAIASGDYQTFPQQDLAAMKHAPKIFKENCEINWAQESEMVRNFVRGLSPYPAAWCSINGKTYKIFKVTIEKKENKQSDPGTISTDNKNYLYIRTLDGWLSIDELQPEGKRKMNILEFFRGNKI